jgi:hypothetical protein
MKIFHLFRSPSQRVFSVTIFSVRENHHVPYHFLALASQKKEAHNLMLCMQKHNFPEHNMQILWLAASNAGKNSENNF